MGKWFDSLPATIQTAIVAGVTAAIVTGIFTVISTFLKDFLAPKMSRKEEARKSAEDVFRRYAEPLAAVSIALFWRLKETLARDRRGYYLCAIEPLSEFERYKLISTYYRFAAMLGCIRALQKELLYFRVEQQRVGAIEKALLAFETALADGHEVELRRLRGLLDLWKATLSEPDKEIGIAVDIERIKRVWMSRRRETESDQLSKPDKKALLKEVVQALSPHINTEISDEIQAETIAQAVRWLFIRQCWIYRDWQSSIGDMMLIPSHAGNRSFDVIGFGEFERMVSAPTEEHFRCLSRVSNLFHELQIDKEDPFDARGVIIRKMFLATASLIEALAGTGYSQYLIPETTLAEVKIVTHPSSTPR